ncbi:MAG: PadR family transcriptional regulator [Propionibacteriaceae bacterium]|nr:PadR family transcriptional regulator [Propionibacteriaceae bacterium]
MPQSEVGDIMVKRKDDELAQLRKGVLEIAVLALLRGRPRYGGELVDALAERPALAVGAGTIYPLLTRLRTAGWVDTTWEESPLGPPRKYYALTADGRAELVRLSAAWEQLVDSLTTLLEES